MYVSRIKMRGLTRHQGKASLFAEAIVKKSRPYLKQSNQCVRQISEMTLVASVAWKWNDDIFGVMTCMKRVRMI